MVFGHSGVKKYKLTKLQYMHTMIMCFIFSILLFCSVWVMCAWTTAPNGGHYIHMYFCIQASLQYFKIFPKCGKLSLNWVHIWPWFCVLHTYCILYGCLSKNTQSSQIVMTLHSWSWIRPKKIVWLALPDRPYFGC